MFSYIEEHSLSPALDLTYHLAPWDRPIFRANTAVISSVLVRDENAAVGPFADFGHWCKRNDVVLVSCRLAQNQLVECGFLESRGFRFIELNYRPSITGLDEFSAEAEISVHRADIADAAEIAGFAFQMFETGRLHLDPQVGPEIGNRRYAAWAANAFHHPDQHILKCLMHGRIIAFMVFEHPSPTARFWALGGLAPGLVGKGLGRRIWRAMLAFHRCEGVREVSTSNSSHNVAVHNLCVSLGFRFPAPTITLHWCPFGPVKPPA